MTEEQTPQRPRTPPVPLVIDIACNCSGRLSIEYNTHLTDTFHTSHEALLKLATAWVDSHRHCQKATSDG